MKNLVVSTIFPRIMDNPKIFARICMSHFIWSIWYGPSLIIHMIWRISKNFTAIWPNISLSKWSFTYGICFLNSYSQIILFYNKSKNLNLLPNNHRKHASKRSNWFSNSQKILFHNSKMQKLMDVHCNRPWAPVSD